MVGFIDKHDRCQSASSQACNCFQGKLHIWSCLSIAYAQRFLNRCHYGGSASNMACRTAAAFHYMPAAGFQVKLGIESYDAVNAR